MSQPMRGLPTTSLTLSNWSVNRGTSHLPQNGRIYSRLWWKHLCLIDGTNSELTPPRQRQEEVSASQFLPCGALAAAAEPGSRTFPLRYVPLGGVFHVGFLQLQVQTCFLNSERVVHFLSSSLLHFFLALLISVLPAPAPTESSPWYPLCVFPVVPDCFHSQQSRIKRCSVIWALSPGQTEMKASRTGNTPMFL